MVGYSCRATSARFMPVAQPNRADSSCSTRPRMVEHISTHSSWGKRRINSRLSCCHIDTIMVYMCTFTCRYTVYNRTVKDDISLNNHDKTVNITDTCTLFNIVFVCPYCPHRYYHQHHHNHRHHRNHQQQHLTTNTTIIIYIIISPNLIYEYPRLLLQVTGG